MSDDFSSHFTDPPELLLRDEEHLARVLEMDFSKEQLAAITAPMAPGAIMAGAGSGKTTLMAARVVWLVGRRLVKPDQILGLTFTNKAAGELAARVRTGLLRLDAAAGVPGRSADPGEPTVATYHAYAGGLVAEHGLRLGFEPDLRLVADASSYQRAARVVQRCSHSLPTISTDLATVVRDLVRLDAQMSDHLVDVNTVLRFDSTLRDELSRLEPVRAVKEAVATTLKRDELVHLVDGYRTAKAADGVADFGDHMMRGSLLAMRCPQVSALERARYRVVLLDEYQDTSVSQRLMLQALFSGALAADGRGHPVTAVGDPCQAIYGWRGASADNLASFPDHFPVATGAKSEVYELYVNRRCARDILAVANRLAAPMHAPHSVVRPLEPRDDALQGNVRAACHETVVDEIDWLVEQVAAVHEPGGGAARWSDIAILVRDGSEFAAVTAALQRIRVPVEVVGLGGLLAQPAVGDVLATLEVLRSLTANAAMLRLLTGPRWRIGARDLALLGQRAGQLTGPAERTDGDLTARLERAVTGADPTEVPSLSDALDDPGSLAYSQAASRRFAALSTELRRLRSHVGEPLVDLVRRVIETLGLDVELGADPSADAVQAGDNLASLVEAVAGFAATDPFGSLHGLLAYFRAEEEFNAGMAVATPTRSDSVKLLTVHRAKGLEWEVVLVPFLAGKVFPNERGRDRWTSNAAELPSPLRGDEASLPEIVDWTTTGGTAYKDAVRKQAAMEERRLGYVAFTRAKRLLVVSGHWWGRTQKQPRGPSAYLQLVRDFLSEAGDAPTPWVDLPAAANPLVSATATVAWPAHLDTERTQRRQRAATAVRAALAGTVAPLTGPRSATALAMLTELAALDMEIDRLLTEAALDPSQTIEVPLPTTLSATAAMRVHNDTDAFARALARPMPRRPSAAARFGTRFHAWVESYFGQQTLLDPSALPGAADAGISDDEDLAALTEAFRRGPFGDRKPHAVEAAFTLTLGGQVIVGRIDAVYEAAEGFCVIDWKTNRDSSADPVQLALYRLAWAELHDLPLERVEAAFYYVRTGQVVGHHDLPGRAQLEDLFCRAAQNS